MKMCEETITVFNSLMSTDQGIDTYHGTIIKGVHWYCEIASTVDNSGLKAANKFTIRIPEDADFSGKTYTDPISYAAEARPDDTFTLKTGTIIIKGEVMADSITPAELKKMYTDFVTVLGVTDNRKAPNAKHFKVVGA